MRRVRLPVLSAFLLLPAACGERHDAADLAVGVAPFEELRGMDVTSLRSGVVRAMRARAVPAPFEGLRELIGAYDVVYAVTGFDGSDGSWPAEDALVLYIEATREWPSEQGAMGAWRTAMREIEAGMGKPADCTQIAGPGFTVRVAEWLHRDGWAVATTYAPGDTTVLPTQTPRHSIAVRRASITAGLAKAGDANPDSLPTWTRVTCPGGAATPPAAKTP